MWFSDSKPDRFLFLTLLMSTLLKNQLLVSIMSQLVFQKKLAIGNTAESNNFCTMEIFLQSEEDKLELKPIHYRVSTTTKLHS